MEIRQLEVESVVLERTPGGQVEVVGVLLEIRQLEVESVLAT